ncbi:hypothetical protein I3760_04G103500 [Carya illinoinensis]|nr:hypothetical protein I3760_04G103500 [Carya illinoinensis]
MSMKSSPMAGWALRNQKLNCKAVDGNEMLKGLDVSQKPAGMDLMQNCDLPPPMKVFKGSDNTVISSMNRVFSMTVKEDDNEEFSVYRNVGGSEKVELLKALRLSQTRAREAEKKTAALVKERDCLANALVEEGTRLFAYRQWVRVLELRVSKLQSQCQCLHQHKHQQGCVCGCGGEKGAEGLFKEGKGNEDGGGVTWFMALAFCLGFFGVGFAFGYTFLF